MSDEPQESTESEPEPSSWDEEAEQLRSSALIPAAGAPPLPTPSAPAASPPPPLVKVAPVTPRPTTTLARPGTSPEFSTVPRPVVAPRGFQASTTPIAPRAASSNDVARAAESPVPAPVLTKELQEQLFGIIRASLDATLAPLHDKQRELEARLAVLRAAPVPTPAPAPVVKSATIPPMRAMQPSLSVDITPQASVSTAPPAAVKPSITSTSYGLVIDSGSRRPPPLEQALANVGPIDMPDFGGNRRRAGRVLVGLLLALVVAAIIATILSYN